MIDLRVQALYSKSSSRLNSPRSALRIFTHIVIGQRDFFGNCRCMKMEKTDGTTDLNSGTSQIELNGGGNIGYLNVTWPFGWLMADREQIILGMTFVGPYTFPAKRVRAIRRYGIIPFIGWGIKIEHNIAEYPTHMVFWYHRFPGTVLNLIAETGFKPRLEIAEQEPAPNP